MYAFEYGLHSSIISGACVCDDGSYNSITSGACVCGNGFSGLDCSTDDNAAPELFRLPRNGLCDQQEWTCRATKVYAYDVFNTETLVCRTTKFWVGHNIHHNSIQINENKNCSHDTKFYSFVLNTDAYVQVSSIYLKSNFKDLQISMIICSLTN